MATKAPKREKFVREILPADTYPARCWSVVQLGTHEVEIQGEIKTLTKVKIGWEVPGEKRIFYEDKGLQPFAIYKDYTLSMAPGSNLRKDIKAWFGKDFASEEEADDFDVNKLIGQPCFLGAVHDVSAKGNTYAKVGSIMKLPKDMICPPMINKPQIFELDSWNQELFDTFPSFLQDEIKSSREYQMMTMPDGTDPVYIKPTVDPDDLPF